MREKNQTERNAVNNLEFAKKMQGRTMAFAVQVVRFFVKLPKTDEARVQGRQLLRAGIFSTSLNTAKQNSRR